MGNQKKLVLASFSQTIADIKTKTLTGENIETVKLQVIEKMFGEEGKYLFQDIQEKSPNILIQEKIVRLLTYKKCCVNLLNYMGWTEVNLFKKDPTPVIYKEFVNLNVVMLYEIRGSSTFKEELWPNIYPGFNEFRKLLIDRGIDLGIISSGYEEFILDVFELHQIKKPLFCVTPEDDFGLLAIDWASKNKPSRLLVSRAINYWTKYNPRLSIEYAFANTIMVGDDLYLDGKMAKNANFPFWYFNPEENKIPLTGKQRSFSNWGQLVYALKYNKLFF